MVVYAEYVFLENFIMNFLILSLTSRFGKAPMKRGKLILASGLGALYAFVIFFPSLHFLLSASMKLAWSMLMIVAAFTPYRFKEFFRLTGTFYLITLVFGGAGFALFYFTNFNGIISNGIFYIFNITARSLFLSCGIGYILIHFCWGYIQRQLSRSKVYTHVKILMAGAAVEFIGLVDTGNSLTDPITRYPVMVVEYEAMRELFPEQLRELFKSPDMPSLEELSQKLENSLWMTRLRMIPFQALGTENGILVGFKPDSVIIEKESHSKRYEEIIIAIYSKKLSRQGDYKALLHPDLV